MFVKMIYWNKKLPTKFSSCNVQRSGEHIWRRNHAVSSSVPGPHNLPPCHWCIFDGCRQGTIWRSCSDVAAFLVNRRSCPSHGLCSHSSALILLLWSLANFLLLYLLWVCPRSLHWRAIQSFSPQQPDLSPGVRKELCFDSIRSRRMIIFQPLKGKHKHQEQRWSQCHLYERQRGLRSCSSQNTCHQKCGSIKHPLFTVNEHSPPCCICGGSIGGATPANQIIPPVERGERVEYNPR